MGKQETKLNENQGESSSLHQSVSNASTSCDGLPADVLDYLVTRPDHSESNHHVEEQEEEVLSKVAANKSGSSKETKVAASAIIGVGVEVATTTTLPTTTPSADAAADRLQTPAPQAQLMHRRPGAFYCIPNDRNPSPPPASTREDEGEDGEEEAPFLATAQLVDEEQAGALEEVERLKKELQVLKQEQHKRQSQESMVVVAAEAISQENTMDLSFLPFGSHGTKSASTTIDAVTRRALSFEALQGQLFGRDAQVAQLKDAFHNLLTSKQKQLVQIGGVSGSGKSTLALQLEAWTMENQNGGSVSFLSGKFDAANGKPYSAIGAALDGFCEALISYERNKTAEFPSWMSKAGMDTFLDNIHSSLDQEDIDLLSAVVPSLLELNRSDTSAATISIDNNIDQTKHRFHHAIQTLVRLIISSFGGPLILVLDDVQWADSASLDLMKFLLLLANADDDNNGNSKELPIMVVATYRDNEVDADHIYSKAIKEVTDQADLTTGVAFTDIHLGALNEPDVCALLHEIFSPSSENNKEEYRHHHEQLASLVHQKTGGNPFYIKQFLLSLERDGYLWYDSSSRDWTYQLDILRQAANATENVIELLTETLKKMQPGIQSILQRIALFGSSFPAILVEIVVHKLIDDITGTEKELISTIFDEGLLVECGRGGWYTWEHDKVRAAALSLVGDQYQLAVMRYNLGRLLLEQLSSEELSFNLFVVTDLLNSSPPPAMVDEATSTLRYKLLDLNLCAGKKALQASAFDSATKYLSQGIQLLPDNKWTTNLFDIALELYSTAAEAYYCVGEFDESKIYCDEVNSLEGSPFVKKRRVNNVLVNSLYSQGKVQEALGMVVKLLSILGCKFPRFGKGLVGTSGLIRLSMTIDKTTEKLATVPPMSDEAKKWSIYLLDRCANISYLYEPGLMPLCILKGLRRTVKYGRTEYSAPLLATIALIVCGAMGDFAGGKKYADLAMEFMDSGVESRTLFLCNHFVLHYQIPVHRCIESLLRSYASGIRSGDLESAFWGKLTAIEASVHAGYALPKLIEDCSSFSCATSRHNQEMIGWSVKPLWQLALNLAGTESKKEILSGEIMNEAEFRKQIEGHAHFQRLLNRVKTSAAFWFDKHELVVQLMDEYGWHTFAIEKETPGANGTGTLYFHCAMSCLALAQRDGAKQRARKQQAKQFLQKLKGWANKGNPNVQHYESLLEAELASCNGKPFVVAAKHYECAILIAGRMNFMNDFGLAHERYGDHCSRNGDEAGAKDHYQRALQSYRAWGAEARVDLLRERCSL